MSTVPRGSAPPSATAQSAPSSPSTSARSPTEKPCSRDSRHSRGRFRKRSIGSAAGIVSSATSSTRVRFVDTNVLLYAVSRDPSERGKAERANEILAGRDVALSVQVLQEFYVQATRESRTDRLTHEQAAKLVEAFLRFPVQEITTTV